MNNERKLICSNCARNYVTVADYMEGDENEVICDQCEQEEAEAEAMGDIE